MARTLRDSKLDSREARTRLPVRGKPYWRLIEPGLHLGYRRLAGRPGTWSVRRYVGKQNYTVKALKGVTDDDCAVADDYAEADGRTVLNFKQAQRKALENKPKVSGPLTVKGAIATYLEFLKNNRKTAADARYRADALILPTLGDIEVQALSAEKLRNWLAGVANTPPRRRSRKGAPPRHAKPDSSEEAQRRRRSSANRVLTVLKAALNRAWRDGKVASSDAWDRVEPFENVDGVRLRYLTVAECKRLINAADPDFRPLLQAALATGCRYGELTRIQVHDFNPDAGTVAIRQSKSGKPRHVVLTKEGQRLFAQWCAGRPGSALLFTKANGQAWEKSAQARPMREACARVRIEPRINFHGLRHTWASLSVKAGMPLMIVARNLGHSDTRMCERHYAHLAPSFEAKTIRKHAPKFGFTLDPKITALTGGR
jgi:integrase